MTRTITVIALMLASASSTPPSCAAELEARTIAGWDDYVKRTEARVASELADKGARFLAFDFEKDGAIVRQSALAGQLTVRRVGANGGDVPDGTIHHWRALILVPGLGVDQLVAALRDPQRHDYRPADVLQWRLLERQNDRERVFLRIQRRELVTAVFNTEHEVRFAVHGPGRVSSRSVSTRIAEIADPGTPRAREKPVGSDRGFLWRLNSYWRYEAVPGGVLVELESVSLSRSVPALLGPVVQPIITRVARESIERTLTGIRDQLGRSQPRARPVVIAPPALRRFGSGCGRRSGDRRLTVRRTSRSARKGRRVPSTRYRAEPNFPPKKSPSFQAGRVRAFATSRPMSRFSLAKSAPAWKSIFWFMSSFGRW